MKEQYNGGSYNPSSSHSYPLHPHLLPSLHRPSMEAWEAVDGRQARHVGHRASRR